jgi:hypothetical protein
MVIFPSSALISGRREGTATLGTDGPLCTFFSELGQEYNPDTFIDFMNNLSISLRAHVPREAAWFFQQYDSEFPSEIKAMVELDMVSRAVVL